MQTIAGATYNSTSSLKSVILKMHDKNSTGTDSELKDSLLRSFTPLGVFAKCFGLLPGYSLILSRNRPNSNGATKKKGCLEILDYLYTISLCGLLTAAIIYCSVMEPRLLATLRGGHSQTDYYVIMFVFVLTACGGIFSFTVFPRKWCHLAEFIEKFSRIDVELGFDVAGAEKKFGRRVLATMIVVLGCYSVGALCLFVLDMPHETRILSDWVMVPITAFTGVLLFTPTAFLIFFMNAIGIRLKCYNDTVKDFVNGFESNSKYFEKSLFVVERGNCAQAQRWETLRILHENFVELVEDTSKIFGHHLMRDYFYSVSSFILYTYFVLFLREDFLQFWFLYLVMDLFILVKLYILSSGAHYLISLGDELKHILNQVCVLRQPSHCATQIQLMLRKLDSPATINAAGFFVVNRYLMTKIVGATATYFVVLVQFKVADHK